MKKIGLFNLKKAIKHAGYTQTEFARRYGIDPNQLNRWLRGAAMPSVGWIVTFAEELKVSVDYLLGVREEDLPGWGGDLLQRIDELSRDIKGYLEAEAVPVPLLEERIAAGDPIPINGNSIENRYFVESFLRQYYRPILVQVGKEQDSMIDLILPGDLLLIDRRPVERPRKKEIYAVNLPEGGTIKYAELKKNRLILTSENKAYKPVEFPLKSVTISDVLIGRVVWIGRELG